MLPSYFVIIGTLIGVIGGLGYFVDTLRGRARPNRVSFFLWTVTPTVTFAAQISQGVGLIAFQTLSQAVLPALILLASLRIKQAKWRVGRFDILCGALSLIGIVLWLVTNVGNAAIILSIVADGMAALPTIIKAFKHPESEAAWPWLITAVSSAVSMLTITDWTFQNYGFLAYMLVCNLLIYSFVRFRPRVARPELIANTPEL